MVSMRKGCGCFDDAVLAVCCSVRSLKNRTKVI